MAVSYAVGDGLALALALAGLVAAVGSVSWATVVLWGLAADLLGSAPDGD